jgi:hypothetical protein
MSTHHSTIVWSGKHPFSITGTGRHEDTLRIESEHQKSEQPLTLVLPTLCITYADLKFANDIGGVQENYPASAAYGLAYFDPPVEILGEEEVERLTWIRGAHRVIIGRDETVIEWFPWQKLVVPRLRIDKEKGARADLAVDGAAIHVEQPLVVKVKQLADGRHIGGIRVEKRHPEWRPPEPKEDYDLWVRVLEGRTGQPLPEAKVQVLRWDPGYGSGAFVADDHAYTSGQGVADFPGRPTGEREVVALVQPGWRATPRAFLALPGQQARFHLHAWKLKEAGLPYTWRAGDNLDYLAALGGKDAAAVLKANGLASASDLKPGLAIKLPCYAAAYALEPGDRFEAVVERFKLKGLKELARANGLADPSALRRGMELRLPGWAFVCAQRGDTLASIEKALALPPGTTRTVGQVYRPDEGTLYEGEVAAVLLP